MHRISPALSAKRAAAGRKGGYATFFKLHSEGMSRNGKLGGRPRSVTMSQIKSQHSSRQQEKEIERGNGCRLSGPDSALPIAIARALGLIKKKEGETAGQRA
jgi:hypothetical protein